MKGCFLGELSQKFLDRAVTPDQFVILICKDMNSVTATWSGFCHNQIQSMDSGRVAVRLSERMRRFSKK